MPHFGTPHTDGDPNAPTPSRPSNAVRRRGSRNFVARPQPPASPANRVLSQEPRRSANIAQAAAGAAGDFLSRRPGLGGTGRDIVHGQGRRAGDFRAGNQNNPITQFFGGIDRAAQSAFPDLRAGSPGTPGTDEPDFFGEAPEGVPGPGIGKELVQGITSPSPFARKIGEGFQGLNTGEFSATDVGRGLGKLGGEALRAGGQSAVRGAGALRRGASNVASGLFEGLGVPTDLLEGTIADPLDPRSALSRIGEAVFGRDDQAAGPDRPGTALNPEQQRIMDLLERRPPGGVVADITGENEHLLPVRERVNRLEEHGIDVERLGQDPTTVIRGTDVSQTRGGQDHGGDFPEAVFDEGFEFPAGTTDAELRDPERLKVLQARNSLSQSLRQVPAPGQTAIPAAVQAKMLADFDQEQLGERGATTRGRERNASLERRTAFTNAVTSRLGLGGSRSGGRNQFDVIGIPFGEGLSGNLGEEAFLIDKTGAQRRNGSPLTAHAANVIPKATARSSRRACATRIPALRTRRFRPFSETG